MRTPGLEVASLLLALAPTVGSGEGRMGEKAQLACCSRAQWELSLVPIAIWAKVPTLTRLQGPGALISAHLPAALLPLCSPFAIQMP